MKITIDKRNFNKLFFPYINDFSSRYLVFYGGAGSGKSHFIAQRMVLKALQSRRKMLFVRKVAATIKDSIYALTLDTLEWLQIRHLCEINRSTFTITLPNGSTIVMKGLDSNEKIKSITGITDLWMEEASEFIYDDFLQLDLRVRTSQPHQEIVLSFNPVSKQNWVYKHFFENSVADCRIIKSTYLDNAFLPQQYINTLENLILFNENYYKIYALGEFATLDKLIFTNYKVEEIPAHIAARSVGMDFGFTNDPTAAVATYYSAAARTLYILDELYAAGLTIDAMEDALSAKNFHKLPITADSAEPRTIDELRRRNINIIGAKKGKDSVLHGLTWLQSNTIIIDPKCVNTIVEFENYTWMKDRKTNEYYNTPIDDFNHCIDALRYATEQYAIGNTVKTYSKALLGL